MYLCMYVPTKNSEFSLNVKNNAYLSKYFMYVKFKNVMLADLLIGMLNLGRQRLKLNCILYLGLFGMLKSVTLILAL